MQIYPLCVLWRRLALILFLCFMGSEQETSGSLSPELAVVLHAQKNAILTAFNAQI